MTEGAAGRVPTVVVGGYLGAGKTTLVNELLRQAEGQRIAVLVNDFGELTIDADLIVGASGDVLALAGGCVCCSFGADLIGTLRQVLQRTAP
ncbi:MAG: GTP-binding protein, partial [Burkholderiaceae bacterium]|nr:GTP-binding protein [Burkholderiaceae bacterium]